MEFKTKISKVTKSGPIIRNQPLQNLMESYSFSDSIFFLLRNRHPNEKESKIFESILISIIDHGMGTTSSLTSRFVSSGGNSLNAAVGAGVLALGNYHGGAIENAMKQIISAKNNPEKFIQEKINQKKIIFGFGHKIYKENDPRVQKLLQIINKLKYKSDFISTVLQMEISIEKIKNKKICLNIDGLIAAILLEMKFPPEISKGIFIIGRVPGLVAHTFEEQTQEKPVRRINEDQISYEP